MDGLVESDHCHVKTVGLWRELEIRVNLQQGKDEGGRIGGCLTRRTRLKAMFGVMYVITLPVTNNNNTNTMMKVRSFSLL